jgi:hypothetical protein
LIHESSIFFLIKNEGPVAISGLCGH